MMKAQLLLVQIEMSLPAFLHDSLKRLNSKCISHYKCYRGDASNYGERYERNVIDSEYAHGENTSQNGLSGNEASRG